MTKFLTLWEVDTTKVPDKPEEQIPLFTRLLNMVKEDFETGLLDWGIFPSSDAGYSIIEGTEQDIALRLLKYSPHIKYCNPSV